MARGPLSLGGVPLSILCDNMRLAGAQILEDGTRKRSHLFAALQCHYVFEDRYRRPAKGNGEPRGRHGFEDRGE
ncbi:MAG: hypothetical protein AAF565_17970, partial [Pseudomonadota bacterium]